MAQASKKCRQYSSEYLRFGFAVMPGTEHLPVCLLCERVFSKESMKPPRLKRHLIRRHPSMSNKNVSYYQALKEKKEIPEADPGVRYVVKKLLICLPSSSLVECAFSIVTDLVTKKRSQLQIVRRGDLRLRVTSIEPNIDRLAQSHLGEPSSSPLPGIRFNRWQQGIASQELDLSEQENDVELQPDNPTREGEFEEVDFENSVAMDELATSTEPDPPAIFQSMLAEAEEA
ncbi:hypothetical protein TTRE_0000764301 [Trichuris trichiura]|uniref:Uncharacterized protein n=1 Tax=Trichuris trichiura TaxID=36087 RepID=A0A077ZG37_TRITR|nr:hypothetical protein TTRE_0000764301 [Trichuris trichiura]